MGWGYKKLFDFNQTRYTAKYLVTANNRLQSLSPANPGSPIDTTKATSSAKATNTDKVVAGKSDAREKGKRDAIQHGEVDKGYVNSQGFCATFSLIWIDAILDQKSSDQRKSALVDAVTSHNSNESRLERIAALYGSDQATHAAEANLKRTNEQKWKGKPEHVQEWLFNFVSNTNGWKTGAWNLTRQRKRGRHRLGLYCDGKNIFVFNPARGEWRMSQDQTKNNKETRQKVFFDMINAAGLASTPNDPITELNLWECSRL